MKKYICLNKNEWNDSQFKLFPIRNEDKFEIMNWRNEQIYHLRQNSPLTKEDQEKYFENVVSKLYLEEKPSQLLFSFLKGNKCVGYGGLVHINWMDLNAEVSFLMNTSLEKIFFKVFWSGFLNLIEEVAFKDLNLHKIYTYAYDIRPHLYEVLEDKSFFKEAILSDHCLFEGEFKDVVIHSKLNLKIER